MDRPEAEPRDLLSSSRRCPSLFAWLCRIWLAVARKPKRGDACLYIPDRIIHKPDPCIYSQFLLMQLGQPVTWDNPDVAVLLGGVEQNTYDLTVDTAYDVVATVHNASRDRPAAATVVTVRWIEFGAGGQIPHPIATATADVPIWPGTVAVTVPWRTPATPGHYCIEVELAHPNDGNPSNNRGWNNTQVKAAASRVDTPVRVFNRWPAGCPPTPESGRGAIFIARSFAGTGLLGIVFGGMLGNAIAGEPSVLQAVGWGAAGYAGGTLLGLLFELVRSRWRRPGRGRRPEEVPCELVEITVDGYRFTDEVGKAADPHLMFAPQPPAWPARVEPALFQFQTGEAYRDVLLIVDAPDGAAGSETFNVSVRQGDAPTGGVTVTVTAGA